MSLTPADSSSAVSAGESGEAPSAECRLEERQQLRGRDVEHTDLLLIRNAKSDGRCHGFRV